MNWQIEEIFPFLEYNCRDRKWCGVRV